MGIALLSLADLFMPLQSLARWIPSRRGRSSVLRYVGIRPSCPSSRPIASAGGCPAAPVRPLRVIRTIDAQLSGQSAGRVVISGRMADVCAELDRLAALEAANAGLRTAVLH